MDILINSEIMEIFPKYTFGPISISAYIHLRLQMVDTHMSSKICTVAHVLDFRCIMYRVTWIFLWQAYPQEKVGVFVRRGKGGPLTVVEYSEMDPSLTSAINQQTGRLRFCWSNVMPFITL